MQLIFHMKRYKTMLDKFAERQKRQGAFSSRENPFEKFQFKDIVNSASLMQDS